MLLKEFFYLQKSDRNVVLVFLTVVVVALCIICFVGGKNTQTGIGRADSASVNRSYRNAASRGYYYVDGRKAELFPFDPNTADSTTLLRLGLKPWQVRNIYKYRAAGGVYHSPQDFARLYGLTVKQYRDMRPYIRISQDYAPASDIYSDRIQQRMGARSERFERDTVKYPMKLRPTERISLNGSDTTALKKVPGIGSGFARAIVRYRERLGGFFSASQLMEIDGFPDETVKYFIVGNGETKKININKLTLSQLRRHPYINFYQAKDIVDYRRLRGPIKSLQDLRLLKDFPPSEIERLQPYLEY